jgi:hypothetical protein
LRITPELDRWLRAQSEKERRTVNQIVTHALAVYRVEGEMMERLMAERAERYTKRAAGMKKGNRKSRPSRKPVRKSAVRSGSGANHGRGVRSS